MLGIVAIVISAIQAVLMLFRQGALVVLAGVLPLAAAGMLTPATRGWFRRVTGWMLALIFYKPAAAMVYATAFTMIGTGKDPRTVLMGFAMIFLSLLALPVLMRFFTWTTGHVADASGGGGFLQTALQGAMAVGALRGMSGGAGGSGPVEQARMVSARLGPADSGPSGASSSGAGARPGTPPAPAAGAPAATPGTAAGSAAAAPAARAGAASGAAAAGTSTGSAAAASAAAPGGHRRRRARGRRGQRTPQGNRGHAAARHPRRRPVSYHDTDTPRDYGGWRRRRGIGMFGFGAAGTAAVLGALLVLIIAATADAAALLYVAPPVLLAGGLGLARIGGEPLALAALRRLRWQYGSARNWTSYRAAVVAEYSPGFQMPGVLAPLTLLDAEDGYGGHYGIVLDRRTGLMTPTLRVIPASTWLANRQDADTWVANWGGWLASLGYLPMVRHVTVTIDTAPEPGTALADSVAAALDPASPLAARQIMGQLAAVGASRCRRRRHARVDLVRPQAEPRRACRPGCCRRRGRPDDARPGISAGHLRGDRAGPGHRRRTGRDRPHRVRPGRPR